MKYQDINIKIFWKVHINNLDRFIKYAYDSYELNNLKKYNDDEKKHHFRSKYKDEPYLYFCIGDFLGDNTLNLSCVEYEKNIYDWFITNNYRYKYEFNDRKRKLNKLKEITSK